MDYLHLLILGLLQGLTEFLPISSSGHLILLPQLAGWNDQGIAYDIFAHLGSLTAVIIYFYSDLSRLVPAWVRSLHGGRMTQDARIGWYLILATIPIAVAGLLFYNIISTQFRNPLIIAGATVFFGLLLLFADLKGKRNRDHTSVTLRDALWIGLAQAFALIPGTSRSGVTMTAGLLLGLKRQEAARFSFLLALPTIFLAGAHQVLKFIQNGSEADMIGLAIIFTASAVSSWAAIKFFIALIERTGMLPYVIYRLLLGTFLVITFT